MWFSNRVFRNLAGDLETACCTSGKRPVLGRIALWDSLFQQR
jgi:hypothetical protein